MIADDMITFIKSDLKVFGVGGVVALALTLGIIFQGVRWICLPILCCIVSAIAMIGLLGWLRWQVTVISTNFISLQLIMTMALAIHLVVGYRELLAQHPQAPNRQLILEAIRLRPDWIAEVRSRTNVEEARLWVGPVRLGDRQQ